MWSALGYDFCVRSSDPAVGSHLEVVFAGLTGQGGGCVRPATLQLPVEPSMTAAEVLDDLVSRVNLKAIAAAEGNLLFHAGAVGAPDGQAAVLCGPSGSGKSTLTVRLVESGSRYLTDETVCLDPESLSLTPYRKPVSLKWGSHGLFSHLRPETWPASEETWLVSPSVIDPGPMPVRRWTPTLVVFPTYARGAGLRVEPVRPGEAAFILGENSSRLSRVRGGALPALARLARQVPAYRVVHDDVHAAAKAVHDLWAA